MKIHDFSSTSGKKEIQIISIYFKKSKSGGKRYNNNKLQIQKFPPKKSVTDYSGSRRGSSQNESGFRSRSDSDVDIFSGTYHFDKYDDGLEEYLNSLGLSGDELGRIVRNAQIRITLRKPLYPDTKWSLTTYETGKIHCCIVAKKICQVFHQII